jgi:hypothetical protein
MTAADVIVLWVVLAVIVVLMVAVWLRERRRSLAADATMSIRDHDQDRRAYGSAHDMPPVHSDADRFGGGSQTGGSL